MIIVNAMEHRPIQHFTTGALFYMMFTIMRELSFRAGVLAGPMNLQWEAVSQTVNMDLVDQATIPDDFLAGEMSAVENPSPLRDGSEESDKEEKDFMPGLLRNKRQALDELEATPVKKRRPLFPEDNS